MGLTPLGASFGVVPDHLELSMGALKPWHIILFVVVVVLLFGAKRLPDAARSLGRSLRIIKAETKGLIDDDKAKDDLAEKADAQHGRQPLHPTEIHPGQPQQPYQGQQPFQGQPQQPYQQPFQPQQPYQAPQGQPQQPYVDPVQRTPEH
jgi:sec-independent protein translocase protein TatA